MFDCTQLVKKLYGHPICEELTRRPHMSGQPRCHRWGRGSPRTRGPRSTGGLRRWPLFSHALGREHQRGRCSRQPPWFLKPRQRLGEPVRASCAPPMTLTLWQGVPLDTAGMDGRAARCMGQTRRHGCWCPADDPWAPVPTAPALTPFADLGVLQPGRWPPPRGGRSAPALLALRRRPGPVGGQHGVSGGRQRIAGAPWHGGIRAMGATGQQHRSPGLLPCAAPACQAHAPARSQGAPPPGVPLGCALERGAGPLPRLGRPATPPLVALACAHRQVVPDGPHDGAPMARHPRPPGTDRVRVHVDAACGCAQRRPFRQRAHRRLKNR